MPGSTVITRSPLAAATTETAGLFFVAEDEGVPDADGDAVEDEGVGVDEALPDPLGVVVGVEVGVVAGEAVVEAVEVAALRGVLGVAAACAGAVP